MAGLWYTETLKGLELRSEVGLVLEGNTTTLQGLRLGFEVGLDSDGWIMVHRDTAGSRD